jgi:hypothetical protein
LDHIIINFGYIKTVVRGLASMSRPAHEQHIVLVNRAEIEAARAQPVETRPQREEYYSYITNSLLAF